MEIGDTLNFTDDPAIFFLKQNPECMSQSKPLQKFIVGTDHYNTLRVQRLRRSLHRLTAQPPKSPSVHVLKVLSLTLVYLHSEFIYWSDS